MAKSKARKVADLISTSDTTKAYRQALRDITSHVNFPYLSEEDWPVKPV